MQMWTPKTPNTLGLREEEKKHTRLPHLLAFREKMADAAVVVVDPPTPPPLTTDLDSALSIPPLDTTFLSQQHIMNGNCCPGDDHNDIVDLGLDFSFEDLCLPSSDLDDLLLEDHNKLRESNSLNFQPGLVSNFGQFGPCPNFSNFGSGPNVDQFRGVFKSTSAELRHLSGDTDFHEDHNSSSGFLNSASPAIESHQISGYLNVPSPESDGSNRGSSADCVGDEKGLNYPSPETQGSGNFEPNVSEDSNNCAGRSVSSSPNSNRNSIRNVVDQEIKLEGSGNYNANSVLKRKKESEDLTNSCNGESMINKYRKSNCNTDDDSNSGLTEEEEKKKARLMRNRESAQLSRQRKKHYVEELEDKVRMMHSTIQDLNAKVSYFMAENVTLRQQIAGGGGAAVPPTQMAPPPPGMYPHPAMMYPWMPCAPPYMMKPQGSQVPLVPIPRLKPQPTQAPKVSKKVESKKNDGPKTKKVASVSFLGLLFFILLFGGLAPMVNLRYGGVREALTGGENYAGGGFSEKHRGRVLMVNGTEYAEQFGGRKDFGGNSSCVHCGQRGHGSGGDPNDNEFAHAGNGSEPLVASLYVPRNDKLIKIDGNLIIHSVLASEKAMASNEEGDGVTGLAVPGDLAPAIPVPGVGMNGVRHPQLRALGASSADKENLKSTATDGRLQQWFREGLAGPMLSSGVCTEVFQFDVSSASASGAIIPASTSRNISEEQNRNSTHLTKGRNRRFLHDDPIPLPGSSHNSSKEHKGRNSRKENLNGNNLTSSMVVSVLVDPRETGDGDVDGVMGTKSVSRIFVVVLIDSVKYVTYSCMLPFMGSAPHLVS